MPNSFQGISSGLAELKNFYQGPIQDQFNEDTPIYRGAEKGKESWSGYQVVKPMKVRRNQGIGATTDGGTLPAIGRQTTIQATISAKFNYLRFGITGPMIKASQNDKGSFVRAAAYELQEGYKDLQADLNRQMSWDGSGDLARVNTTLVASTTLVIKGREDTEEALKFMDVGTMFDVYTSGGALVQAGLTVSSISSGSPTGSTATMVITPALSATAGDIIVRAGSTVSSEVQGLLTQLDGGTSTVFGIDRSLYLQTQGNVIDLNGAQLTLDKMQQAYNESLRRGGGKLSAIYCDFASQRMYQKLLTADKRYVNSMKGDGGFANKDQNYLEFNGIPVVADKDCPTRFFFLPESVIKKYVLAEMEFADETGSMYLAQTDADSFETRIRMFVNLFNEKAAACSVLTDYVTP
jgi:hypothetical protein